MGARTKNKMKREQILIKIANNNTATAIEDLISWLSKFLSTELEGLAKKEYHNLIVISGRYKGLIHERNLGIMDSKEEGIERSRINYSLIGIIDNIPNIIFRTNPESLAIKPSTNNEILRVKQVEALKNAKDFNYDIFLSFSSKNLDEVKLIGEELRGYGFNVFMSNEALKWDVGKSFFEKIEFALKNSKHFILLCTPNSMESEWVKTEYETFYNEFFIKDKKNRTLIVYKGKGFDPEDVPLFLRRLQFANNIDEILNTLNQNNESNFYDEKVRIENEEKLIKEKRLREQEELERKAIEEKRKFQDAERAKKETIEHKRREEEKRKIKEKELHYRNKNKNAANINNIITPRKRIISGIVAGIIILISLMSYFNLKNTESPINELREESRKKTTIDSTRIADSLSFEKALLVKKAKKDSIDEINKYSNTPKGKAEKLIIGKHPMTLQWISWDYTGTVNIVKENNIISCVGVQNSRSDNKDYLKIEGTIEIINEKEFLLRGTVRTKIYHINNGNECLRKGTLRFKSTKGRQYWRMREMTNPCDGVTDYVDIYFKLL